MAHRGLLRLSWFMPRKPRLRRLTFSLLTAGLTRDDALRDSDDVRSFRVPSMDPDNDSLFVASRDPHSPWWVASLEPQVDGPLDDLVAASSSGALLLEAGGRLFAVTFGTGRYLLDADAFEQDFGLKVVLNAVAPNQLRSVDAKTIDETTLHTRRDVSRDSSLAAFDLDTTRDLLRSVTGTPQDDSLARRLIGADAVGLNTRARLHRLPALAERLPEAYTADDYKAHFEFIDYLTPEKRAGRLRELEHHTAGSAGHERCRHQSGMPGIDGFIAGGRPAACAALAEAIVAQGRCRLADDDSGIYSRARQAGLLCLPETTPPDKLLECVAALTDAYARPAESGVAMGRLSEESAPEKRMNHPSLPISRAGAAESHGERASCSGAVGPRVASRAASFCRSHRLVDRGSAVRAAIGPYRARLAAAGLACAPLGALEVVPPVRSAPVAVPTHVPTHSQR